MLFLFLSFGLLLANRVVAYWTYEYLNVSQWEWQSSVVVGDWLYIDGGQLWAIVDGQPKQYYLGQTVSIDLSQSWTNVTVTKYSSEYQRAQEGHWTDRPALFYDSHYGQVYQWGGWPLQPGEPSRYWAFTPNKTGGAAWTEQQAPVTNEVDQSSPVLADSAFVTSDNALFSLGGNIAETYTNPYIAVQGFLEHDFGTTSWTNSSSLSATSSGFLVGASGVYAPNFGGSGVLVFVGGAAPATQVYDPDGTQLVNMSDITIYDIANRKWYHQPATGTVPPPRQYFCAVGSTSSEGTFELFVLGGSTNSSLDTANADDSRYRSVFAMSLPAFAWFQSSDDSQVRRAQHACQLIGKRQMLVIGGNFPSDPSGNAANDPWPNGLGVFDMTQFAWSDIYNASAQAYAQPAVIREYYDSGKYSPQWTDPALANLFPYTQPSSANSNPTSTSTSASTAASNPAQASTHVNTSTSTSTPTHIGVIVGGVVGGIGGLLLLVVIAFFLRHRKQKAQSEQPTSPELDSSPRTEHKVFSEMESPIPELYGDSLKDGSTIGGRLSRTTGELHGDSSYGGSTIGGRLSQTTAELHGESVESGSSIGGRLSPTMYHAVVEIGSVPRRKPLPELQGSLGER